VCGRSRTGRNEETRGGCGGRPGSGSWTRGAKVAAGLKIAEGQSAEIIATLDEVRDDGIVLSEISDLGSGPTLFCPWDSLKRVRDRPPWLRMPHEEPELGEEPQEEEYYELYEWREAPTEDVMPEPPQGRQPSAHILERVVSIAQRRTVGDITVVLASLELFGEGLGVLRYRISYEEGMFEGGYGIPEPELVIRDESDRELPWSPRGSSSSESEADGEVEIRDLPETGELEVEVTRLVFDEEVGEEVVEDSYDGPWIFSFSI
jgi:hypothetical protein